MKYGILIQDLDRDQLDDVLARLDGESVAVVGGGNEGEFDSKGMPWDERIHAGTKRKTAKGEWQKKKGVDDATFEAVANELRLSSAQSAAPAMPTAPAAPVAPVAPAAPTAPAAPSNVSQTLDRLEQQMGVTTPAAPAAPALPVAAPAAPTAPVAPAAAPAAPTAPAAVPAAAPQRDFAGLMAFISNLYRSPTPPPQTYADSIVTRINQGYNISTITTITDIANEPAYVTYAWQCIDVDLQHGIIKAA